MGSKHLSNSLVLKGVDSSSVFHSQAPCYVLFIVLFIHLLNFSLLSNCLIATKAINSQKHATYADCNMNEETTDYREESLCTIYVKSECKDGDCPCELLFASGDSLINA